ncbi:MAG: CvpA family protein [Bryobacteraceae bacterium]
MTLNWLDITLGGVMIVSIVTSFMKGFSREMVRLAAAVLGFFAGLWFYGIAGSFVQPYVSSRGVANFLGFLLIFFSALIAGSLLGMLLGKLLKWTGLGGVDRLLGAAFGFVRGAVIALALILAIVAFAPGSEPGELTPPRYVVDSQIAPYILDSAHILSGLAPYELKHGFGQRYERVQEIWKQSLRKRVRELPSIQM